MCMNDNNNGSQSAVNKLIDTLKGIGADAEVLARSVAGAAGEKAQAAADRIKSSLSDAAERAQQASAASKEHTCAAAKKADDMVKTNPWPVVGAAAVLGLVAGALLARRK